MQEFVENIAHQIKTPLSVMTMKLEMLQDMLNDIKPENTHEDDNDKHVEKWKKNRMNMYQKQNSIYRWHLQ